MLIMNENQVPAFVMFCHLLGIALALREVEWAGYDWYLITIASHVYKLEVEAASYTSKFAASHILGTSKLADQAASYLGDESGGGQSKERTSSRCTLQLWSREPRRVLSSWYSQSFVLVY